MHRHWQAHSTVQTPPLSQMESIRYVSLISVCFFSLWSLYHSVFVVFFPFYILYWSCEYFFSSRFQFTTFTTFVFCMCLFPMTCEWVYGCKLMCMRQTNVLYHFIHCCSLNVESLNERSFWFVRTKELNGAKKDGFACKRQKKNERKNEIKKDTSNIGENNLQFVKLRHKGFCFL